MVLHAYLHTRSWPLSTWVGKETRNTPPPLRRTQHLPQILIELQNSAAIRIGYARYRNGIRSSRGSIRGTIGLDCCFTTVAQSSWFLRRSLDSISRLKNLAASPAWLFRAHHKLLGCQSPNCASLGSCCSPHNAVFKLSSGLFRSKSTEFPAVGVAGSANLCMCIPQRITDQPPSANTWFVGRGVVASLGEVWFAAFPCPGQKRFTAQDKDQDPNRNPKIALKTLNRKRLFGASP